MNTNRRNFFGTIGTLVAGFTILPAATTYNRVWNFKRSSSGLWTINPEYDTAPYEVAFLFAKAVNQSDEQVFDEMLPVLYEINKELPCIRSNDPKVLACKYREEPLPTRFNIDSEGNLVKVKPLIEI